MGARGPAQKDKCDNGHDLRQPGSVRVVHRKRNGTSYDERQCVKCHRDVSRAWWRENRAPTICECGERGETKTIVPFFVGPFA